MIPARWKTRKCRRRSCRAGDFHTHHLTWVGRLYYRLWDVHQGRV